MWEIVCAPWLTPHRFAEGIVFSLSAPLPHLSPASVMCAFGLLVQTTPPRVHNTCRVAHIHMQSTLITLPVFLLQLQMRPLVYVGRCVPGVAGLVYLLGALCANMLTHSVHTDILDTYREVYTLVLFQEQQESMTERVIWWIHTKRTIWWSWYWHILKRRTERRI